VNTVFTWELDARYVLGAQTELPGQPSATPAGTGPVSGPSLGGGYRNGLGVNLMGELNLTKRWTLRLGASMDPALRSDNDVEPLTGGAKSAGFSGGIGYKAFGGELNVGYQFRQTQDIVSPNLQGSWTSSGYQPVPGNTRVEGMGHLWAAGYKRTF
jgi:hypothetical protein